MLRYIILAIGLYEIVVTANDAMTLAGGAGFLGSSPFSAGSVLDLAGSANTSSAELVVDGGVAAGLLWYGFYAKDVGWIPVAIIVGSLGVLYSVTQ
jgi:hypothetical protein